MADTKKIKTALVSVFHKDGLDELLAELNKNGVQFLSTGGTQAANLKATRRRWQNTRSQK